MTLNEQAAEIHAANAKWWQDPVTGLPIQRNKFELLALIISEVCECLEGERKDLMDDKLPHRKMAEVEMADVYIRIMDFAGGFGERLVDTGPIALVPENKGEAMFRIMQMICREDLSVTIKLSFVISKIQSYCAKHSYNLDATIREKMEFNRSREDHTHEARQLAGWKKW